MAAYTLLKDQKLEFNNTVLYRVQYENGKLGGWIESEDNLDQDGNCQVLEDGKVYGNAKVQGNAWVFGEAQVYNNAVVNGVARVSGQSKVFGYAIVTDDTIVMDQARVRKNAWITGISKIMGNAVITDNAALEDTTVSGDARIAGEMKLIRCNISGDVELKGNETLTGITKTSSLSPFEELAFDLCNFMLKVTELKNFEVRDEYDGGRGLIKDYFDPMALGKANFDSNAYLSIVNDKHKPIITITKEWQGIIKVFRVSSRLQAWIDTGEQIDSSIIVDTIADFKRYIKEKIELAIKADQMISYDVLHLDELQELAN